MVTFVVSTDSADTRLHCPDITWLHIPLSSTRVFSPPFFVHLTRILQDFNYNIQYSRVHIAKQKRVKCSQKRTRRRRRSESPEHALLIQPLMSILSGFPKAAVK